MKANLDLELESNKQLQREAARSKVWQNRHYSIGSSASVTPSPALSSLSVTHPPLVFHQVYLALVVLGND